MSIMELSQEALEQVSGGYVFNVDERSRPQEWEVISDSDGSVVEKVYGWRKDAQARARELGFSEKELDWAELNALRKYGPQFTNIG